MEEDRVSQTKAQATVVKVAMEMIDSVLRMQETMGMPRRLPADMAGLEGRRKRWMMDTVMSCLVEQRIGFKNVSSKVHHLRIVSLVAVMDQALRWMLVPEMMHMLHIASDSSL